LLFVLSVAILGVIGVIGIYIRFAAVLCSILLNGLKILADAFLLRFFPGVVRHLETKAD
jgi:hypothetical protein